jgi:hypothetical protein
MNESVLAKFAVAVFLLVHFPLQECVGQEAPNLMRDLNLTDVDWRIRIERTGHEFTLRVELGSNGKITVLRGDPMGNQDGKWNAKYAGEVPKVDCDEARMSATKLLRRFTAVDRARNDIGRDVDGSYSVTVATRNGIRQAWFLTAEQRRDSQLTDDLRDLITVMQRTLPEGTGIVRPRYSKELDDTP